jgi:hypothetical protein
LPEPSGQRGALPGDPLPESRIPRPLPDLDLDPPGQPSRDPQARIDLLERRVAELERRLAELERLLRRSP